MALVFAVVLATTPIAEGKLTRYNPGVMEEVVQNRLEWGQLDLSRPHFGYVAVAGCEHIDERLMIEWPDGSWSGPHLVADCGDPNGFVSDELAVELSYPLAEKHGVIDDVVRGVRVWKFPLEKGGTDGRTNCKAY